jgi:predicted MPP superfamily phosphohydrolase
LLIARTTAITAGVVAVGTTGFGVTQALGAPRIKRRQIALAKLPRSMDGYRIALVSDIHLGPLVGVKHTTRIVEALNGMDANIVAVVGDLVDGTVEQLGAAAQPLRNLRSKDGAFFVTGNHEYFSGFEPWLAEVADLGLKPLRNQRVELPGGLDLAGVNDVTGEGFGDGPDFAKALGDRDPAKPVVLLAHQPIQVHQAAEYHVDLQLSGHTHGGQMVPFNFIVGLQQPVISGYDVVPWPEEIAERSPQGGPGVPAGTQIYVTNGAGFWGPPVRVGAPPDVTLIELRVA